MRRSSGKKRSAKSRATRAAADSEAPSSAVVVATSGGPDSGAALLLARETMPEQRLFAVYVDHGLRPRRKIKADIAAVRAQARRAGAKVVVLRVKLPRRGVSVEAAARVARYRVLAKAAAELGASIVITGHHRDDIVETMLLALARGSGVDGLAAMRARRPLAPGITLVRPLLGYSKAQLRELMRLAGVQTVDDETNEDPSIRRNALRVLLAELERRVPGANRAMARSAMLLAADKKLLESVAADAWAGARVVAARSSNAPTSTPSAGDLSAGALREMPIALRRRVIRHALKQSLGTLRDVSFAHVEAIARALEERRGGSFHAGAATVQLSAGRMSVVAARRAGSFQERAATRATNVVSTIVVPTARATARDTTGALSLRRVRVDESSPNGVSALLDVEALPPGTRLTLRAPRPGDKCVPAGRHRSVPVARFLAKSGVPKHRRKDVPLLCRGDEIVAALGVRVMAHYVPRGKDALLAALEVGHGAPRSVSGRFSRLL